MADKRIDQLVAATTVGDDDLLVLQQNNQAKKLSGKKLGDYVYAAAAGKVAEVEQAVADAQAAIDNLESQKDTIAQAVADMADLGTDTTLTTAGMAADAEATGNKIKNLESDYLAQMEQGTGTPGSIVTFTDGADNAPLKKLVIGIEPVQDLHGYDHPWPAGGGKNKFDAATFYSDYKQSDGSFIAKGSQITNMAFDIPESLVGTQLTFSAYLKVPSGSTITNLRVSAVVNGTTVQGNFASDTNYFRSVVTFTPVSVADAVKITFGSNGNNDLQFKDVQLEASSTVTDFAPYENICPITGWTGANVARTGGKNLLDISAPEKDGYYIANGTYYSAGTYSCYLVSVKPNTTYTISGGFAGIVTYWGKSLEYISGVNQGNGSNYTFTTPDNCFYFRRSILKADIDGTQMLELGSTASTYEAPNIATIPITFPSEAGTVYGGTLENNGDDKWKLRVEWVYNLLNDPDKWYGFTNDYYRYSQQFVDRKIYSTSYEGLICSYVPISRTATVKGRWEGEASIYFGLTYPNTTLAQIKADSSDGKIAICYELATPITYTLTSDQVRTLLNLNNVWADTGDIEELIYYKYTNASRITEDVQNAIEPMIAGVEETMTATTNYAVGDILIADHTLLEATAPIATGETIVSNSNCTATTVSAQLDKLSAKIDEALTDLDGYYPGMTVGLADNLVSTTGAEDKVPYNFRTSGGAIDIGDRETETIVGGTIAWNQLVTTDTNVSKTKSGSVVSVTDAVAENAQSLVVGIEPVQDLHGYDHPWPAGGGKNILNVSQENEARRNTTPGVNFVYNGSMITIECSSVAALFAVWPFITVTEDDIGKTFIFSGYTTNDADRLRVVNTSDNWATLNDYSKAESFIPHTFTSDDVGKTFGIRFYNASGSTQSAWNLMVNWGSTASTSYSPYENICPITGFTGANINRTGKNLFDQSQKKMLNCYSDGSTLQIRRGIEFHAPPGTYTIQVSRVTEGSAYIYGNVINADGSFSSFKYGITNGTELPASWTFSLTEGQYYVVYDAQATSSDSVDKLAYFNYMVVTGSTAAEYVSYTGVTIPVSFPSEAGTVYGGTLDVTSGELVVNAHRMLLANASLYRDNGSYKIYQIGDLPLSTDIYGGRYAKCSVTDWFGNISSTALETKIQFPYGNSGRLYLSVEANTDPATVEVCYELAEPQTYTLTPQQVQMLLGANNVWSDTGDINALTYLGTTNEITALVNHKYLTKINGAATIVNGSGQVLSGEKGRDNIFNLTHMFGSSIANYVYTLEQTTAGIGVSWFNRLFPKPYYSYNTGELMSVNTSAHKMVGFNAWDGTYQSNTWVNDTNGTVSSASGYNLTDFIKVVPNAGYYKSISGSGRALFYDINKTVLPNQQWNTITSGASGFTVPVNAYYVRFVITTTYLSTFCVNLSLDGERDGEYEDYEEHVYPLDTSLTLRGIPKKDSNDELYYDGDIYESDGTVTRKYGIVDLGTLTWTYITATNETDRVYYTTISDKAVGFYNFVVSRGYSFTNLGTGQMHNAGYDKTVRGHNDNSRIYIRDDAYDTAASFKTAMSGVYCVYELTTPITESAIPYTNPQLVDDFGTEEYIDYAASQGTREVAIPVGHDTTYVVNLRAKLEMAPDSPEENGDYIVRKTNEGNSYVPLTEVKELPNMPTINGSYNLTLTVANGTPTLTWVMV